MRLRKTSRMKILILVDLLNDWALHNRAKAIQKHMPEFEFEIRAALGEGDTIGDHESFDIIHFNFTWGLTDYTKFILNNLNKCVLTIVNERSLLVGTGVDPEQLNLIFSKAKYMTSVNQLMSEMTGATYIPNGIDNDIFKECRSPIVGYSGTGRINKGVHLVEKACDELGLVFRGALYRYKNDGRAPDFKHDQMNDFYKTIDLFVHASETEGFSNTVLEALACNVPVLMTKQGAWKEFEGWVDFIEPTIEGIKDGLRKYTGRRLVNEKFLWSNIMPLYKAMYERVYEDNHRL